MRSNATVVGVRHDLQESCHVGALGDVDLDVDDARRVGGELFEHRGGWRHGVQIGEES